MLKPLPRRHCGFTLIELVVTVAIVAILVSLAAPSMRKIIDTQHVRSGADNLQTALLFARSEAIKRAVNVSVVPSGGKWTSGWAVQLPDNSVLRQQASLAGNLTQISGTTITYQVNGRVTALPNPIKFETSDVTIAARCVKVDLSGRPSVVYDTDGNNANGCN
jgi:type IV fimbrial biogenesis protein FimT